MDNKSKEPLPFTVVAGKYDDKETNTKYSDDFGTLDEAIEAYKKFSLYPWSYIFYKGYVLKVLANELGFKHEQ